jgi:hypothetical protein
MQLYPKMIVAQPHVYPSNLQREEMYWWLFAEKTELNDNTDVDVSYLVWYESDTVKDVECEKIVVYRSFSPVIAMFPSHVSNDGRQVKKTGSEGNTYDAACVLLFHDSKGGTLCKVNYQNMLMMLPEGSSEKGRRWTPRTPADGPLGCIYDKINLTNMQATAGKLFELLGLTFSKYWI